LELFLAGNPALRPDPDQAGDAMAHGSERLAADHGFRTTASHPASEPAVRGDDGLVPWPRGGGRITAHHRDERARTARGGKLCEQRNEVLGYWLDPLDRSASQTLSEVTGMSMFVIP
jgi:hypothetical protein